MLRAVALPLAVAALLAAGCSGGGDGSSSDSTSTATGAVDASGCRSVDAPEPRDDGGAKPPTTRLDPERTYRLVFRTSCGTFTVTLDQVTSPAASASLVSLARAGFFDDTIFHRIVPDFVIQGGDPTQTGSGGPGYSTVDPPPPSTGYVQGVMAMAKTADEPAGTAGSQFFVVTRGDAGLPPDYAYVGKVTTGLGVVRAIGTHGDATTEQPTQPIVVESVTVRESA